VIERKAPSASAPRETKAVKKGHCPEADTGHRRQSNSCGRGCQANPNR
jgi:hypothetical protein